MRRKQEPRAGSRVALLLAAALLGVWALGILLLTAAAAETAAQRFVEANAGQAEQVMNVFAYDFGQEELTPWRAAHEGADAEIAYLAGEYLPRGESGEVYGSAAVLDAEGNIIACSWADFILAETYSEADWEAQSSDGGVDRVIFFDRGKLTADVAALENAYALKFSGEFTPSGFAPASIEGIDTAEYLRARYDTVYVSIPEVMRASGLEWEELYRDPELSGEVTLYARYTRVNCPERMGSLRFAVSDMDEVLVGEYASLDSLTSALVGELNSPRGKVWGWRRSGANLVVASAGYLYEYEGQHGFNLNRPLGDGADVIGGIVCTAGFSPWLSAARELVWYYALALAAAALLWLAAFKRLHSQLIVPARNAGDALLADGHPPLRTGYIWRWREPDRLREGVKRRRDELIRLENENARLTTALDYAKAAEENRRRTVSAIAHELKTPLAVIHSYAEGLREHIAEDKREKYVSVILAEAERSDAMVMEMLDFSRLEAGRIKLARDEFSLAELTRAVFEKLEPLIAGKGLRLSFSFPRDSAVAADEQRVAEVVENLASNAVKYTPAGGRVEVKIVSDARGCTFSVANEGPRLTPEQLERVWEPFYRADAARSAPGAGLGLAIARSIIQLHGGSCFAKDREGGVEFGFTLAK